MSDQHDSDIAARLKREQGRGGSKPEGFARLESDAHQDEDELNAAELNALMAASPFGAGLIDRNFRYRRVNNELARLNGVPARDHIGRTVREVIGDPLADMFEPLLHKVLEAGRPQSFEAEVPRDHLPYGYRVVRGNFYPVKAGGRTIGIGAALVDVTDLKAKERELRDSNHLLKSIIEGIDDLAYIKDREGRVILCNEAMAKFYGRPASLLVGNVVRNLLPPESRDHLVEVDREVMSSGQLKKIEETLQLRDGSYRTFLTSKGPYRDSSGRIVGFFGISRDITEQKQMELKFRAIAENIPQLVWTGNSRGYVTWYNKRWSEFLGRPTDDLLGFGWQKVPHPDHVKRIKEKIMRHVQYGEYFEDTYPILGKDGEYHWFLSRAVPVHDEKGRVAFWFGTNTDITDYRKVRERLEKVVNELENERDIREQFVAALTHDLRNPISAIKTNAELLRRYPEKTGSVGPALKRIASSVDRADRMIEDLLNIYRVKAGEKYPLVKQVHNLTDLCKTLIEEYSTDNGHRLKLEGPQNVLACVDSRAVIRALENLIMNALKYGAPSGPIEVKVEEEADHVCLSVKNEGEPIPPENLPKLFKPFQRLDQTSSKKGWGIGLALVKGIVEAHEGNVEVESTEKRGTIFKIRLPKNESLMRACGREP